MFCAVFLVSRSVSHSGLFLSPVDAVRMWMSLRSRHCLSFLFLFPSLLFIPSPILGPGDSGFRHPVSPSTETQGEHKFCNIRRVHMLLPFTLLVSPANDVTAIITQLSSLPQPQATFFSSCSVFFTTPCVFTAVVLCVAFLSLSFPYCLSALVLLLPCQSHAVIRSPVVFSRILV